MAVPDPRKERGKIYPWVCLLAIICVALLSNQTNGSAIVQWMVEHWEEIRQNLSMVLKRMPSGSTLRRALRLVDIEELERLVGEFVRGLDEQDEVSGVIKGADGHPLYGQALDGKELRGASAHGTKVELVSIARHDTGATLVQQRVQLGSSETVLARELLANQDLAHTVVTMDAKHTNQLMAKEIIRQRGHYLMVVKKNQKTLYEDIELLFQTKMLPGEDDFETYRYESNGHGRLETRTLTCSSQLSGYLGLPGSVQVIRRCCEREFCKSGKREIKVTYGITSLARSQAGARQLERLWRRHWTIENKDHYVRDETMREDRCQMHKGNAAQALAALRNLLIARLRDHGWSNIAEALRHYGASVREAFAFLAATC